ncbi:hypothetical protein [Streptomyces mirabilis]|uniref:hypothetical protein n=1 Tax=Streptomyces mirabilis TaxID=68239 RepID=UPI003331F59E
MSALSGPWDTTLAAHWSRWPKTRGKDSMIPRNHSRSCRSRTIASRTPAGKWSRTSGCRHAASSSSSSWPTVRAQM